jgi:glycosyltransferase involved in cell wall biosynthesis
VRIAVNTRLLLRNRLDGMGWFTHQTLQRITRAHPSVHFTFIFDRLFDPAFVYGENVTPIVAGPPARHPLLYYAWLQWSVKPLLSRLKPELFLSPDGFLPLGAKCRQLPVIHDLNFVTHPRDSKWMTSRYYNHFFPRFAKAATRIATVSEFSKSEIVRHYHVKPEQVDVVNNGIHSFFRPLDEFAKQQARKRFSYGKPYFLFVGSMHPRKNLIRLIESFGKFRAASGADVKLLLAGAGFWALKELHAAVERSPCKSDIILTERLSDEDLAQVMGAALALTYVPYYEGFGIPLVEAMQAEVPIIAGQLTSLPEIAGDAALYVDPMNADSISEGMLRMFRDESLRQSLVEKGKARSTMFSWDRTAELLWSSVLKCMDAPAPH